MINIIVNGMLIIAKIHLIIFHSFLNPIIVKVTDNISNIISSLMFSIQN
jgi:hypothetical protein